MADNTPPAQVFGGSCDSVISVAKVTSDVGAAVELAPTQYSPESGAVPSLGGVNCRWNGETGNLALTVLASRVAPDESGKALTCDEQGAGFCFFNKIVDGYWFSGALASADQSDATAQAGIASLEKQLTASAERAGTPPKVAAVVGAWKKPANCEELGTSARIASAAGWSSLDSSLNTDADELQPDGYYAALRISSLTACDWESGSTLPDKNFLSGFVVDISPGGAWAEKVAFPGQSMPVDIPGADAAFATSVDGEISEIDVFSGSNWLSFQGGNFTTAQVAPIATALINTLNQQTLK